MMDGYPYADLTLARRLEFAEASAGAAIVEARARFDPASGACSAKVGDAWVLFDGIGSPISGCLGLGMSAPVNDEALAQIESFFLMRGCDVSLEMSPLADAGVLGLLRARGYHPIEAVNVMFRPVRLDRPMQAGHPKLTTRLKRAGEDDLWAAIAAQGWGHASRSPDPIFELSKIVARCETSSTFFAELDGQPIATGTLWGTDNVALLAGASTIPEHRNRGAQAALLEARLIYAAHLGCDLAVMNALPGSPSQRNAEKHGFRIAYTRIKWNRPRGIEA